MIIRGIQTDGRGHQRIQVFRIFLVYKFWSTPSRAVLHCFLYCVFMLSYVCAHLIHTHLFDVSGSVRTGSLGFSFLIRSTFWIPTGKGLLKFISLFQESWIPAGKGPLKFISLLQEFWIPAGKGPLKFISLVQFWIPAGEGPLKFISLFEDFCTLGGNSFEFHSVFQDFCPTSSRSRGRVFL